MKGYIIESIEHPGALHKGCDPLKGDVFERGPSEFTLTIRVSGEFDQSMIGGQLVQIVPDD